MSNGGTTGSECAEVIPDESRSILLGIISQLAKGVDLHRVTLPTFVLEPRSFLERATDFMSHPDLILRTPMLEDPIERFIDVVRYFLSGWHIQPKGVKKPYNPVLGEFFRGNWVYDNGTKAYFVSEQVSHHPPVSAYFYASPENNLVIRGQIYPKSKFLGNSVASIMHGGSTIEFTNHPGEIYTIGMPNIYARGILFGTMVMELGDSATVQCSKTGLVCDIEFKTKGLISGTYNAIVGKIRRIGSDVPLYEISGKWSDVLYIKKVNGNREPTVLFDAHQAMVYPVLVAPIEEQEAFESRRKWRKVTQALHQRDMDAATDEKTAIEDEQRQATKERMAENVEWQPRFFYNDADGRWTCRLQNLSGDPQVVLKTIHDFIFDGNAYYKALDGRDHDSPSTDSPTSADNTPSAVTPPEGNLIDI